MSYNPSPEEGQEGKSLFGVIIHSFFVVPFLIAVFSVLLFAAVRLLTVEQRTVYDYLEDVKVGSLSKRWQSAFELSKILSNPKLVPADERFVSELTKIFVGAKHDDERVRQYLALAMARTGNKRFVDPLLAALPEEKEENLYAVIYSLGLLRDPKAAKAVSEFIHHPNSHIRLAAVMALGNIGEAESLKGVKGALNDEEENVRWDAAIALAKSGDLSGREILLKLLDRKYLKQFPEIDSQEQDHIILVTLEATAPLHDPAIEKAVKDLAGNDLNMKVRRIAMEILK